MSLSFAAPYAKATLMQNISFESSNIRAIDFCVVKKVAALLRNFILGHSYHIFIALIYKWPALYGGSL